MNRRKRYGRTAALVLMSVLSLRGPVYAGSLNANEQELMSIIRGTYTYKGVTYRVKSMYIQAAQDYLMQDNIDCTDEQKQKALNTMYSSIQQGIDEGYLEPAYPQAVSPAANEAGESGGTDGAEIVSETGENGSTKAGGMDGTGNLSGTNGTEEAEAGTGTETAESGSEGNESEEDESKGNEELLETEPSPEILALEQYAGEVLSAAGDEGEAPFQEMEGAMSPGEETEELQSSPSENFAFPIQAAWTACGGSAAGMAGLFAVSYKGKLLVSRSRHHDKRKWGRPG